MKKNLFLIFCFLQLISFSQTKYQSFDSLFNALYKEKKFNGNLLIAEKGNIIYQKSFGLANEQTNEKLNENSIFELASVSKQFTAMAIVILKEKGKLNYTDKISKHIPEFINYSGNITIQHLLQHTSGIYDYGQLLDSLLIDSTWDTKTKIATNKDIIECFAKHKPKFLFTPNEKWEYSNTGYALLASIIEKVSGKSYADFLKEFIFTPLQMTHSFVYTRRYKPQKIENYAFGYVYSDSLKKNSLPDDADKALSLYVYTLDGIVGDGAVNSTVVDLLKWDRALYTNQLVSKESINKLFTSGILNDAQKTDYGFGWRVQTIEPFGKLVSHGGSWPGYKTYIERHLDNDKTIIFLQNNDNEKTTNPIKQIRAILYDLKPEPQLNLSLEELKQFAGDYKTTKGTLKSFFIKDAKLYITINEQVKLQLQAITKTTFKVIGFSPDVMIEFFIKDGIAYKHIATQEGRKVEAERIN
jgi:CubicO group peptidase (beta-lactamase class C family)